MKYICELCGMIYDEAVGDPKHGIPAGTEYAALPQYYECSRCGSAKEAFSAPAQRIYPVVALRADAAFWNEVTCSDQKRVSDR